MKNLINRIPVLLIIACFIFLVSGCQPETTQNDQKNSNLNDSNKSVASNEESSSEGDLAAATCTGDTDAELKQKIIARIRDKDKYEQLEEQYDDGNFTLDVQTVAENGNDVRTLSISGFIYGKKKGASGYPSYLLMEVINHFRRKECVKMVLFRGNATYPNFTWIPHPNSPTPTPNNLDKCEADITREIKDSKIWKKQGAAGTNRTFSYAYDTSTRILQFSGTVGDKHSNKLFKKLFDELDEYMSKGCITKIEFVPPAANNRNRQGFGWTLCEPPSCEEYGDCVACGNSGDGNTNSNTNSNSNSNSSNTP